MVDDLVPSVWTYDKDEHCIRDGDGRAIAVIAPRMADAEDHRAGYRDAAERYQAWADAFGPVLAAAPLLQPLVAALREASESLAGVWNVVNDECCDNCRRSAVSRYRKLLAHPALTRLGEK